MNPPTFQQWYNNRSFQEVAYSHLNFDPSHSPAVAEPDPYAKFKVTERPTLRKQDRDTIVKHSAGQGEDPNKDQIEWHLNRVTKRIGLHWIIMWDDINYMGRDPQGQAIHREPYPTHVTPTGQRYALQTKGYRADDPSTHRVFPTSGNVSGPLKTNTKPKLDILDWRLSEVDIPPGISPMKVGEYHPEERETYFNRAHAMGKDLLHNPSSPFQQLAAREGIQASPANTIVVSKATSRVHNLTLWLMMHNIGHAVLDNCTSHYAEFQREIHDSIVDLQQSHYEPGGEPPTGNEIVVMLSRMLDASQIHRNFTYSPKQANNAAVNLNSFIGGIKELLYDLIAFYLNNGGHIRLRPRGEYQGKTKTEYAPDRRGDMARAPAFDDPEVIAAGGKVRDWAYRSIAADPSAWAAAGKRLSKVVDEALGTCTWAKVGGPLICHDLISVA